MHTMVTMLARLCNMSLAIARVSAAYSHWSFSVESACGRTITGSDGNVVREMLVVVNVRAL